VSRSRQRAALAAALVLVASAAVGFVSPPQLEHQPRKHRLHPPPPIQPARLTVDETEWSVRLSRTSIPAGSVRLRIYNRGMDDHDLVVVDHLGVAHALALMQKESGTLDVILGKGRYKLFCSLFAGTPFAHETLGMFAYLDVS
jgi:hypothetical protein